MPKRSRLTRTDLAALSPKRRLHGRLFSVSYAPLPAGAKYTCVVSKKVSAKASVRNLVKRRCREAIRRDVRGLPAGAYVFTAKREAAGAAYADIQDDMRALAGKLRDSA